MTRAAEFRIVRGAHLVRLHAKFDHALGEHRNKHHVLWFHPDGDDSVRDARLSVSRLAKYQFHFPICQVAFFGLPAFLLTFVLLVCGCPGSSWKLSGAIKPYIKKRVTQ